MAEAKEIKATLRYLRMGPRKVRLVADTVRGLSVIEAKTRLTFLPKAACLPVRKLLASAVADAVHNFGAREDDLFVKRI